MIQPGCQSAPLVAQVGLLFAAVLLMHMVTQMFLFMAVVRAFMMSLWKSLVTDSRLRRTMKSRNDGAAKPAITATKATVTSSSIRVKPLAGWRRTVSIM